MPAQIYLTPPDICNFDTVKYPWSHPPLHNQGAAVRVMSSGNSPVSIPADPVLWSSGSALTLCIMSWTVHHCPRVSDTVAHRGTCGGCHCLCTSADTPLTALRRASVPPVRTMNEHGCVCLCACAWACVGLHCAGVTQGLRPESNRGKPETTRQVCHSTSGEGASGSVRTGGGHTPNPNPLCYDCTQPVVKWCLFPVKHCPATALRRIGETLLAVAQLEGQAPPPPQKKIGGPFPRFTPILCRDFLYSWPH